MSFPTPRPRRRAALAAATLALTTVAAGALSAESASAAAAANVTSTIRVPADKAEIGGRLSSPKAACEKKQTVTLHFKNVKKPKQGFVPVARDTTNGAGAWSIPPRGEIIPPGKYFVTVPASDGCQAVRSKTIRVRR